MKTIKFLFLALLGVTLSVSSCKKDKDDPSVEKDYFTVENGAFINSAMPASTGAGAPTIGTVTGNSTVLAGGSNPITINTTSTVTDVLVGVEGMAGYYKIPYTTAKSTNTTIMVVILMSQSASNNFTIVIALANGTSISTHYTIPVVVYEGGTGKLQVSLSWDKPNDVDLHLFEPGGEEIYFGNSESENGGILDVDSNAGCSIDNINNENITYGNNATVANGLYTVKVNLWSPCNVTAATTYVVTVRYNGNIISPVTGTNPYTGTLLPSDEDIFKTPMTFQIGTAKGETSTIYGFQFRDNKKEVLSPQKM